jgi:uncharacterized membrane protein YoaK (UPF0700 family)
LTSNLKIIKEKLRIAALLAINAGFIDAYTFFHYDARFAGAQTGNLVQAGIAIAQGKWGLLGDFLLPIFFFMLGIIFRTVVSYFRIKHGRRATTYLLWVQMIFILIFVTLYIFFFDFKPTVAISALSFIMAIQMNNFSVTRGLSYGSIFSTANMRSFAQNIAQFFLTKDKEKLKNSSVYLILVVSFFVGSTVSTLSQRFIGEWTLYGSAILLSLVLVIFHFELENLKSEL